MESKDTVSDKDSQTVNTGIYAPGAQITVNKTTAAGVVAGDNANFDIRGRINVKSHCKYGETGTKTLQREHIPTTSQFYGKAKYSRRSSGDSEECPSRKRRRSELTATADTGDTTDGRIATPSIKVYGSVGQIVTHGDIDNQKTVRVAHARRDVDNRRSDNVTGKTIAVKSRIKHSERGTKTRQKVSGASTCQEKPYTRRESRRSRRR